MKKGIAIVLALVLTMGLCTSVFAASDNLTNSKLVTSFNVNAKKSSDAGGDDVISVNVEWGAMEFTYNSVASTRWDPSSHTNKSYDAGTWSAVGDTVTVANHSNVAINVDMSVEAGPTWVGGTVTPSIKQTNGNAWATAQLASAATAAYGDLSRTPTVTAQVVLTGPYDSGSSEFAPIGEIKVQISKA